MDDELNTRLKPLRERIDDIPILIDHFLGIFAARYSRDPSDLEREAREVFPVTGCARDGMELDVPFADAEPAS